VEVLVAEGHIQLEHYFVDGIKVEAKANKHHVIWPKHNRKYQITFAKIAITVRILGKINSTQILRRRFYVRNNQHSK
jgi:hypothetical protein